MTKLLVRNGSDAEVVVYITLGATPGCCQDVSKLKLSDDKKVTPLIPLQGYFTLQSHKLTEIEAPEGEGLNGNLAFGTQPLNCPTERFPHGVNLFEFIINNGFQENGQETVDISCVCGANARVCVDLTADDWTSNGGAIAVGDFENGPWDHNTGRVGVFPYSCDNCTASDNPPECVGQHPEFANALPICNVQRPASGNQGAQVIVLYRGAL